MDHHRSSDSDDDDEVPQLCDGSAEEEVATSASPAANSNTAAPSNSYGGMDSTTDIERQQQIVRQQPQKEKEKKDAPVPLCILTGWLGSGKTTLLNRLLTELGGRGMKIAVVQNEVSAGGVEDALRLQDDNGVFGEMLELANGCVCCSVKGDFAMAMEQLLRKRKFDYVFVECSGLADPGPLARMFWVDEELESNLYLDCIVSLADAKHLPGHLTKDASESLQVIRQLAFADHIILNKKDLVDERTLTSIKNKLHGINMVCKISVTEQSAVNLDDILYTKSFDVERALPAGGSSTHSHDAHSHEHEHLHDNACEGCGDGSDLEHNVHAHGHGHDHQQQDQDVDPKVKQHVHDHSITTFVMRETDRPIALEKFKGWLGDLLWTYENVTRPEGDGGAAAEDAMEIFRMKAIIWVEGSSVQYFLQGVQSVFEVEEGSSRWGDAGTENAPHTKVVIIGRNLDKVRLETGFRSTVTTTPTTST